MLFQDRGVLPFGVLLPFGALHSSQICADAPTTRRLTKQDSPVPGNALKGMG
jgi:hypothetical protein